MPRGPRIDTLRLHHHVWHRGVGKRAIFLDDDDRRNFVARFRRLSEECGIRCYAWVLMENHFHLVLQTTFTRLREFMARLLTGHARYFNERHGHVGHVFQNRYGSRVILDDADLAGVVVYALRNPREANLVASVATALEYEWSNLPALLGARPPHAFECAGATLALFGSDAASARKELVARIERGVDEPARSEERAEATAVPALSEPLSARLAAIVEQACAHYRITECELRSRLRTDLAVNARSWVTRRAVKAGLSRQQVAAALGRTESGICRLLRRPEAQGS
jgi:REP element-mobilizing transposase RayT